jgi:hypothetical protein
MVPTGIEIIVGVIRAIPGNPYELIIFTSMRLRFVKRRLGAGFDFKGNLCFIAVQRFISPRSKKRKAITPQLPAMVENANMGKKLQFVAAYNAGTPTTNFTIHNKKTGTSFSKIGQLEFLAKGKVAGVA